MMLGFIVPSFFSGIRDGFNFYAFSSLLIFYILLSVKGHSSELINLIGGSFLLAAIVVNTLIVQGSFDQVLGFSLITKFIAGAYFIIGLFFLITGLLSFMDWIKLIKSEQKNFFIKAPAFMVSDPSEVKLEHSSKVWLIFGSVVMGVVTTFLNSVGPKDFEIYLIQMKIYSDGGNVWLLFGARLVNSAGYILPLIVVWLVVKLIRNSPKLRLSLARFASLFEISFSALVLATGTGLIYLLFG